MKQRNIIFPLLLSGLTGLMGCDSSEDSEKAKDLPLLVDCPSISYASNLTNKSEVVIQDEANYLHYLEQINLNSNTPVPDIDFTQTMLILVNSGEKSSSGHQIEITRIDETETSINVHYTTTTPPTDDNNCNQDTVITYPYCLASTPVNNKAVNFIETKEVSCN
ncbi:MAG: protease complex subunit PrcB family protein [Colwellia sp.]